MATSSFSQWLDTTASTKRQPAKADGKIGSPVTNLASLSIVTPLPVDPNLKMLYPRLQSAKRGWITYADTGADIQAGDLITVSGYFTDADVVATASWVGGVSFVEIIIAE